MPPIPTSITSMSLAQMRAQLDAKDFSVAELTDAFLQRITATNDQLNSFIILNTAGIPASVQQAQDVISQGHAQPLAGIPFAVKDNFCTKGLRTTAGSNILKTYIPPYSATAVERCTAANNAILLGKTNMDEFAMGISGEYSAFGPTKNPYNLERVPGGTSSGSAAAVAAGQVPFALGTDTGGSVRQPAAFCSIVGLRPTYGRISRYGVIAMASSFDTIGILARTVPDVAYILQQLAGPDGFDATAFTAKIAKIKVDDYLLHIKEDVKGWRVGIPSEWRELQGMDEGIKQLYEQGIVTLTKLGVDVVEVSLPHSTYSLGVYYILVPAEVSSNLARYDGVQYGQPSAAAHSLAEIFTKTRQEGFGPESKRRIMIGTFCLSAGYVDAYYKRAQRVRTLIKQDFTAVFDEVDAIFAPTSPIVPFKIGEKMQDPIAMYLADILTAPASIAGVPAISVPAGFVQNLPVGMQFIAPQFAEASLLQLATAWSRATHFAPQNIAV